MRDLLLVGIDFESYYSTEYSLKRMSVPLYVRDPQWKCYGAAVKFKNSPSTWLKHDELETLFVLLDWSRIALYGHNMQFDGFVLSDRYGIRPALYVDTLAIARAIIGGQSKRKSLDQLGEYLGLGGKLEGGKALNDLRGVCDPTPEQMARLADYARRDIDLTYEILKKLSPRFPKGEWAVADWVTRMMTEPVLELDEAVLERVYLDEVRRKQKLIDELDLERVDLNSNKRFAEMLMFEGVTPPTKKSKATGKETYAFSKTDQEFVELQKSGNERVAALVRGRLGIKSSIEETRALAFLKLARTGKPVPVPLNYSGAAQTHRLSGAANLNWQNLGRKSPVRKGIRAPKGHVIVAADSAQGELRVSAMLAGQYDIVDALKSGRDLYSEFGVDLFGCEVSRTVNSDKRFISKIACVAENSLVRVRNGLKPIECLTTNDAVWDGEAYVRHSGAIYKGEREVITYDGLTATPDHYVYTECGRYVPFWIAAAQQKALRREYTGRNDVWTLAGREHKNPSPPSRQALEYSFHRMRMYIRLLRAKRQDATSQHLQFAPRSNVAMSELRGQRRPRRSCRAMQAYTSLRTSSTALPEIRAHGLWSARHKNEISQRTRLRKLDTGELAPQKLYWGRDRPNKQRRSLRTRKLAASHPKRKRQQQKNIKILRLSGCASTPQRRISCHQNPMAGSSLLAYYGSKPTKLQLRNARRCSQALSLTSIRQTSRTWDVTDAGPNSRFTVSGRLVSNCLSLAYQAGWRRFQAAVWSETNKIGTPLKLADEEAMRIVEMYRTKYSRMPALWRTAKDNLALMAQGIVPPNFPTNPPLTWRTDRIIGPSGLAVKYPKLRWHTYEKTDDDGNIVDTETALVYTNWAAKEADTAGRVKIYGGKAIENLSQALLAEIIRHQTMIVNARYPVKLQVHDALVIVVPEREADEAARFLKTTISQSPPWWPSIPLDADVHVGHTYSELK